MEVILLQHVDNLGRRGEVVRVAPGYARNFLMPRSLATLATAGAKRRVEHESKKFVEQDTRIKDVAQQLADRLAGIELSFAVKADEDGKLFGSVTAADVHAKLSAAGVELDRKLIALAQHLKVLGTYEIPVKLHPDVHGTVKVNVVRE
jgi:large subunit ribosomal protein L9